jgi:hypothetical protein
LSTNVSEVRTASIIRYETSVDNYFTRQYIPEDNSELHTRRRENLKSHISCQSYLKGFKDVHGTALRLQECEVMTVAAECYFLCVGGYKALRAADFVFSGRSKTSRCWVGASLLLHCCYQLLSGHVTMT